MPCNYPPRESAGEFDRVGASEAPCCSRKASLGWATLSVRQLAVAGWCFFPPSGPLSAQRAHCPRGPMRSAPSKPRACMRQLPSHAPSSSNPVQPRAEQMSPGGAQVHLSRMGLGAGRNLVCPGVVPACGDRGAFGPVTLPPASCKSHVGIAAGVSTGPATTQLPDPLLAGFSVLPPALDAGACAPDQLSQGDGQTTGGPPEGALPQLGPASPRPIPGVGRTKG